MGFRTSGLIPLGRAKSVEQYQAGDPRLSWTPEMAKQANVSAKGGQPLPPTGFSGQQIGAALQQQALQQQALADKAYEQQQTQQQGGFGRLS
mgnify:CR=1 FL=1